MRQPSSRALVADRGFTLVELLIAMAVVLLVMAGTMTALSNAYRSTENAKTVIDVNNNLRIGADLMVRDFIQLGQGLPTGRLVQVPSGTGAARVNRPHAQGSSCTQWPAGTVAIQAVTPGPGCGPTVDGVATDMVTTLAVDSVLDMVPVYSFDLSSHRATVAAPAQCSAGALPNCTTFVAGTFTNGVDITTGGPDDVKVGDLIMFTKGSVSSLVYVTAVDNAQTFTFATGDPMNLNQVIAAPNDAGTVNDLAACVSPLSASGWTCNPAVSGTVTNNSSFISRIRMISYYIDNTLDPTTPRLIRHMNWGDPAVAVNQRGRTVAFAIENLQFTYDMVDSVTNFANVRMVDADLTASGACSPAACSANQIRKVNVFLSARSQQRFAGTARFVRNSLNTQVSLRSLALVDRYR
jgi:prepilin-type N-terminal cleavage/methylation domain-containing protein